MLLTLQSLPLAFWVHSCTYTYLISVCVNTPSKWTFIISWWPNEMLGNILTALVWTKMRISMLFQGFAMRVQQRKEGVGHVCTLVAFLCNSSVEVTPECRNDLLLNSFRYNLYSCSIRCRLSLLQILTNWFCGINLGVKCFLIALFPHFFFFRCQCQAW